MAPAALPGFARRPHLRAAVLVRCVARDVRSDESFTGSIARWTARGCPCPGAGLAGKRRQDAEAVRWTWMNDRR
jgi:hypothetical protein